MARHSADRSRDNEVREALAALLRRARDRSGWSQMELQRRLAQALGVEFVSPNTISRYERGILAPTLGTLDALCELLGGEEGALVRALAQALGEPVAAASNTGATQKRGSASKKTPARKIRPRKRGE